MVGRFLDVTLGDPFSNLALEEALFFQVQVPTLRVWNNQRSVVIGRAQLAKFETDLARCDSEGVPIVRRFTAGGAVYNGKGNLNWSFIIPRRDFEMRSRPGAVGDVFALFASVVVRALKACKIDCTFNAPNSICNKDGKISGMAAYISRDGVLCHGTLLVNADLHMVETLTRPSSQELKRRYPRSNVTAVANCNVDIPGFVSKLKEESHCVFEEERLSESEMATTSDLLASKYSTREWNLGDPFR